MTRREALKTAACGFGWLAFSGLMRSNASTGAIALPRAHFPARARRIIFIFMQGGPSQVDTFDYKPALAQHDGKQISFETAARDPATTAFHRVMKSPWAFSRHGASGQWISELFPHLARHSDDLCFIRSMRTEGRAHGPATLYLHCGSTEFDRPSLGSWVTYGLGSENQNLPGFVTISPSLANGARANYGSAFLPAQFQGMPLGRATVPVAKMKLRNVRNEPGCAPERERAFNLVQQMRRDQLARHPADSETEAMIRAGEVAWRMQAEAPGLLYLSLESSETLALYGIGEAATDDFGRQCLLARRLSEAGVRFVQITYGDNTANPAWDQHSDIMPHARHARAVDRPIAGLLADLKRRGLLEDTIVWWGSEFGRTPYAERNGAGRDHNPEGFTMWLAGGGVRSGVAYGQTDELGHRAVENPVHMRDLHATLLSLMGLDHEQLTAPHLGRAARMTDPGAQVVRGIIG